MQTTTPLVPAGAQQPEAVLMMGGEGGGDFESFNVIAEPPDVPLSWMPPPGLEQPTRTGSAPADLAECGGPCSLRSLHLATAHHVP